MPDAKYQFIVTDEVSELGEIERDLATIHNGDHSPKDHMCHGCVHHTKEVCWAMRHGEEINEDDDIRKVGQLEERDCHCGCHFLIEQCFFIQNASINDGRPIYRLENDSDGMSIDIPSVVYENLMELPEEERDRLVEIIIRSAIKAKEMKEKDEENE
jgi:hypothetical protein